MQINELLSLTPKEIKKLSIIEQMTYYRYKYEEAISKLNTLIHMENKEERNTVHYIIDRDNENYNEQWNEVLKVIKNGDRITDGNCTWTWSDDYDRPQELREGIGLREPLKDNVERFKVEDYYNRIKKHK